MSENKIKVIIKYPNKEAEVKEIDNDYKVLSNICEGLIDMVSLPADETIDIICNDEFLYNGMEANIVTPENEGVIAGPIILAGYDFETGDTISLTDEQIKTGLKYLKRNIVYNMTIERAYLYSKVIGPLQQSYKDAGIDY